MAAITRTAYPSLASGGVPTGNVHRHDSHPAGVALNPGDIVYLATTGLWQLASGAAADALAVYWGVVLVYTPAGESCSPHHGIQMFYADGTLTPSAPVYLGTTPGGLDTAATTGGTTPIGRCVDASHIQFFPFVK